MIKKDLCRQISDKTGLELREVNAVMDCFIDTFQQTMLEKKSMYIRGFATFKPALSKYTKGRDILRGIKIDLAPHYKIKFRVSRTLANKLKEVPVEKIPF